MTDTVNDVFRSGAIGAIIPPAPASPTAQTDNSGGPLNIRHIKRGHAFAHVTGRTDVTITSTSWVDVAPELIVRVATSDRPLLAEAACMALASSGTLYISLMLDGVEVSSASSGLCRAGASAVHLCPRWVASPGQGTHTISLAAKVSSGGSGTIYCANDVAVLAAREV